MTHTVVANYPVPIDTLALEQSPDMFYNAQLDYGSKYSNWLRIAFNKTVDVLKKQPLTAGNKASRKMARQLNVQSGVTLRVCKDYAPIQAVYKVETIGSQVNVTVLEFSETFWPQWL